MSRCKQHPFSIRHVSSVFVAIACVAFANVCAASTPSSIEVFPILTSAASTAQLLHGDDASANTSAIAGELRLPIGSSHRMPVVLFLHGDAGSLANQSVWIDDFLAMGIAVFTLDSFSGRGLIAQSKEIGSIRGAIPGALTRTVDAFRALELLAKHPRIDPSRIAVMGASSGGRVALITAMKRFSTQLDKGGSSFAAYVALYPPCNGRLADDERVNAGPIRIFIGASDNITRASSCERYVARLKKAGVDIAITVYPNAYHGFDNPPGTEGVNEPAMGSSGACDFEERDGQLVNVATGRPLTKGDACITKGMTAGRDANADAAVRIAVRELMRSTLLVDR
jgi:dienelactone hydrolase